MPRLWGSAASWAMTKHVRDEEAGERAATRAAQALVGPLCTLPAPVLGAAQRPGVLGVPPAVLTEERVRDLQSMSLKRGTRFCPHSRCPSPHKHVVERGLHLGRRELTKITAYLSLFFVDLVSQ